MPEVVQVRCGTRTWVASVLILLWVAGLWALAVQDRSILAFQVYLFFITVLSIRPAAEYVVLTGAVVSVITGGSTVGQVPLATVHVVERSRGRVLLRWRSGRVGKITVLRVPDAFADTLDLAISSARAAKPGTVPMTAAEAAGRVLIAPIRSLSIWSAKEWLLVPPVVLLALLAAWLNQPLLLLPIVGLPFWMEGVTLQPLLLLGDSLLLVSAEGGVRPFPTAGLKLAFHPYGGLKVETEDEQYPRFRPAPEASPAAPKPDRGAAPPVFICESCSGRTRREASESGHGISPKESKPM